MLDSRELMTGKNGKLIVTVGELGRELAEINEYAVVMNTETDEYRPMGSLLTYSIPQHVSFRLTFTEMVVRDDCIVRPLFAAMRRGGLPEFHFQGVVRREDGTEQRILFTNAVPIDNFDLQTVRPGEVIERQQSFALNCIPRFIYSLASGQFKKG